MTPEIDFLKNMEMFFNEIEFTDVIKNRVLFYLREYTEKLPKVDPIVITEKVVEYRPVKRVYKKDPIILNKNGDITKYLNEENMTLCDKDDLLREANKLCDYYELDINEFMRSKCGKSKCRIVKIRKIFCRNMIASYWVNNNQLGEFFNVDHSSITYYLYDKPNQRPSNKILKKRKIYAEEKI